jgi:uncharacterized protein (TIGR02246 family)
MLSGMNLAAVVLVAATSAEVAAVHATLDRYVAAWLANSETAVMALLTTDAVFVPGEKEPYKGADRIRKYWFGSSTTVITRFSSTVDDVQLSGDLAVARGIQSIEWTAPGERWRTHGNYMTVLRRTAAGWRIAAQMAANTAPERLP